MRIYLLLLVFILLGIGANASWQTYQNGLGNPGASGGEGYFPLATANFSSDYGMDFQPLADDLDADGKNEIIVFSNDSLIILSPQLAILSQIKVGTILGQPALFNFDDDNLAEIIFNARQNSSDYFFAYQFNNSDLRQEFNITLSNPADFAGIKCVKNTSKLCVFKDKRNYINVVDMSLRRDDIYNTSSYNETRQTIPAIGDIDNDGNPDAVFWFNKDGSSGYGFLAFDLKNRSIKWDVDEIFSPLYGASSAFALKGQPVLVDLNSDGRLEIAASVFYHDDCRYDVCDDYYTELFVYNSTGGRLFSRCGKNSEGSCYDGSSGTNGASSWEGTNAFVMDANNDKIDEICLIKDKKEGVGFKDMALDCYDYSGSLAFESELSPITDTVKAATTADVNDDGDMEVVTENSIYLKNGTLLFGLNLGSNFVIPVNLDGSRGVDLLWTKSSKTKTFLDSSNYTNDLSVSGADISFSKSDGGVNVTAIIRNIGQAQADSVKAVMYNSETLENKTALLSIRRNGNATFSAVLGLREGDKVLVSIDPDNEINESDETNNFAAKEFNGLPHVFVSADLEPFNANSEFQDYIKNKLASGYYTENENEADIKVYVGKNNPRNKDNSIRTSNDFEFGYDYGSVFYHDKTGGLPHNGLVGAFKDDNGKTIIMIVGNEIEGDVAAAKEFIKNQATLLNVKDNEAIFIEDEDSDAVRVYDYFHLGGNNEHYKIGDDEFRKIVHNALNDEMFDVIDKSVVTSNGITLRLRNLKPNISNDYLEYLNSTGIPVEMPVVLARGIHSNLTTWENLGSELANDGRDLWLIEVTGGPNTECDTCPNYNFSDLTDIYWPTLINGILNFTGKEKIQYVGHSNGGRIAIVSLSSGIINPNKIDTLIGVAVPSAFEGYSTFGNYFGKYGGQIMDELEGKSHVSLTEVGNKLRRLCLSNFELGCGILTLGLKSENKMSFNVDKQYYLWINDTQDEHIGKNLQLDNFYLIEGWVVDDQFNNVTHDFIVSEQDEKMIYNNLNSPNKKHYKLWGAHTAGWSSTSLPDRDLTKSIIKDALNKKPLDKYKSNEISSS